jgi:phospholipid/cholesterol/gamma-HCH transport system ATP-binding protein
MNNTIPLIEFKNVTKRFGTRVIHDSINLQIYERQVTTIIGLSGAGKSLLLKQIIGLLQPEEGTILFRGKSLAEMTKAEIATSFAQMSYMFQENALFDSMTVYDNIALPLQETTNLDKAEIDRRVLARIEQTELSDAINKFPAELSGGMQKRVALARALITDPQIVLFDEPTSGQDPVRKNAILSMIAQYQRKFGFTAILVSHEIPDVYFISNRILALYDRKIVFQGTPEELENFDHPFKDEVIHSLEGLQKELSGLYSKRQFQLLNHTQLKRRGFGENYCVVVFTLENLNAIVAKLGHDAAQEAIHSMGVYIDKHFGSIGGFSTRRNTSEVVTMLPFSDIADAESILQDFIKDFQGQGIRDIWAGARKQVAIGECVELTVRAGIAQGQPISEIDSVIESAKSQQKEIGRLRCEERRRSPKSIMIEGERRGVTK